jgi:hypothetical protein
MQSIKAKLQYLTASDSVIIGLHHQHTNSEAHDIEYAGGGAVSSALLSVCVLHMCDACRPDGAKQLISDS